MKVVYSHQNPMMIHVVVNALANAGVESQIRNEMIMSVLGEGAGFDAWPEVLVTEANVVKAQQIIDLALAQGYSDQTWQCPDCGEINEGSFDVCWRCNSQGEP